MHNTFRVAFVCAASLLLAGCVKSDRAEKDSATVVAMAPVPAPRAMPSPTPTISLSAVAGKWRIRSIPESARDTSSTNYVLTATADTTGWVIAFPSGVKVPLHVIVSGDSVLGTTGTFPSQRRKGLKVRTESTMKLRRGKLLGMTIAHYSNAGPDSVLRLSLEGTKMP